MVVVEFMLSMVQVRSHHATLFAPWIHLSSKCHHISVLYSMDFRLRLLRDAISSNHAIYIYKQTHTHTYIHTHICTFSALLNTNRGSQMQQLVFISLSLRTSSRNYKSSPDAICLRVLCKLWNRFSRRGKPQEKCSAFSAAPSKTSSYRILQKTVENSSEIIVVTKWQHCNYNICFALLSCNSQPPIQCLPRSFSRR